MSQIEHPAYKEEDLTINTPEELEEAKREAGVSTWKEARKRYLEENILSPKEIDEIVAERFAKEFLKGNSEQILEARETYDMSDDLLRSAISRAINRLMEANEVSAFEYLVQVLEKNDSVENINNLFSSISDKEFHDSIEKSIKDYSHRLIKNNMPYLGIKTGTLGGGVAKSDLAQLDPEIYKERSLENMANRMKKVCEGGTAIALKKIIKIFFGEEISEGELGRELVDEVTVKFLDSVKKNFDEHRGNVKHPEYDWEMKGANFPDYYLERMVSKNISKTDKSEETIIQESIQELKKDYENCVANVNQIRQEFSLPPL